MLRLLTRWRHSHGFGVHSPWAYNLLTQVIYNDSEYYAYAPLRRHFGLRGRRLRTAQLLFRLANHEQPARIIVPANMPEAERAYLQAGCLTAEITEGPALQIGSHLTVGGDIPPQATTFDLGHLTLVYTGLPLTPQHY